MLVIIIFMKKNKNFGQKEETSVYTDDCFRPETMERVLSVGWDSLVSVGAMVLYVIKVLVI